MDIWAMNLELRRGQNWRWVSAVTGFLRLLHVDALKARDGVGSPREGGSNEEEGNSESAVRGDKKEARRRDQEGRRLRDADCRC